VPDLGVLTWPLVTERLELRPLQEQDARAVHGYRGRPDVTAYLPHPPLSEIEVAERIAGWRADPDWLALSVRRRRGGGVVGDVQLMLRRSAALAPEATGEWDGWLGYALHPGHQGSGLGTEAVGAVLDLAFGRLALRRVGAKVFAPATPSSRLLARLGLRHEGTEVAAVLGPDGTWLDDQSWAILRREWCVKRGGLA
jgi:RimJ/RimL family protein N-acetyltransferase